MNEKILINENKKIRIRVEVYALDHYGAMLAAMPNEINGYIELPAGAVNVGEDLIAAARRETAEEAGWVIKDCKVVPLKMQYEYCDKENGWLSSNGFTHESYRAVVCSVDKFLPTRIYGSEGDSRVYSLVPIHQVCDETTHDLNTTSDSRAKVLCKFRLDVINIIRNMAMENLIAPNWSRW